ncbi:MAG: SH3 domain-containing protein [Alphaproteobacteria bacterium]|nr:SH3 domain-containing protein [Alphaproteobacteria bacterium]
MKIRFPKLRFFLLLLTVVCWAAPPVLAQDDGTGASGLPLPRFASLRADEINLRAGPGTRYPIEWVYTHEGLPVEITAEYDIWRRIRDWEGSEGWVQKSALTGKRAAIILTGPQDLFDDPEANRPVIAHVTTNAVGHILSCKENWCELKFGDIKGYMPKSAFWGAYANEVFD